MRLIGIQAPKSAKRVRQTRLIGTAVPVQRVPQQTVARLTGIQVPKSVKRVRQAHLITAALRVKHVQK